jgi:hypothetical protein
VSVLATSLFSQVGTGFFGTFGVVDTLPLVPNQDVAIVKFQEVRFRFRGGLMRSVHFRIRFARLAAVAAFGCAPALAQIVNLADGPGKVVLRPGLPRSMQSAMSSLSPAVPTAEVSAPSMGLPFYTANYTSLGGRLLRLTSSGRTRHWAPRPPPSPRARGDRASLATLNLTSAAD